MKAYDCLKVKSEINRIDKASCCFIYPVNLCKIRGKQWLWFHTNLTNAISKNCGVTIQKALMHAPVLFVFTAYLILPLIAYLPFAGLLVL